MKNVILIVLVAAGCSSAFAETYDCPMGQIAVTGEDVMLVDWGRPGTNIVTTVKSRSYGQLVIYAPLDSQIILNPAGKGKYLYAWGDNYEDQYEWGRTFCIRHP